MAKEVERFLENIGAEDLMQKNILKRCIHKLIVNSQVIGCYIM